MGIGKPLTRQMSFGRAIKSGTDSHSHTASAGWRDEQLLILLTVSTVSSSELSRTRAKKTVETVSEKLVTAHHPAEAVCE